MLLRDVIHSWESPQDSNGLMKPLRIPQPRWQDLATVTNGAFQVPLVRSMTKRATLTTVVSIIKKDGQRDAMKRKK
jgi:hypothetical protein